MKLGRVSRLMPPEGIRLTSGKTIRRLVMYFGPPSWAGKILTIEAPARIASRTSVAVKAPE